MRLDDIRVTLAVAACITAAALTAMSASAHEPGEPIDLDALRAEEQERFAATDADGDSVVSVDEFVAADSPPRPGFGRNNPRGRRPSRDNDTRAEVFGEADADGDGQLSQTEFEAVPDAVQRLAKRRHFNRLDQDDDGFLTADEYPSRYDRLVALDANGDGLVTSDEMPRRQRRGRR